MPAYQPYYLIYALYLIVLVGTAKYVYSLRKSVDEMHGMMIGMTLGYAAGLVTGAVFVFPFNFLVGTLVGTIVGLFFGIPFGKFGGHLGIMEGVMSAPMGGMMGAMLFQMIKPFNLNVAMFFLSCVFLITLAGISYAVNCRSNCCAGKPEVKQMVIPSTTFFLVWGIVAVVLLVATYSLNFSLEPQQQSGVAVETVENTGGLELPPALRQISQEIRKEAVLKDDHQEIDLEISASRYSPNVIIAKKGILLKINAHSAVNAGCDTEIVFPDFNVDEVIPPGSYKTFELMPAKEGTYGFRCSMNMIKGKLIVQ